MCVAIDSLDPEFREDLERAVKILKDAGCSEIFIFGSVPENSASDESDIDLAIRGCPRGMFFKLLGKLIIELEHPVDLVDLDREKDLGKYLEREGLLLHVA